MATQRNDVILSSKASMPLVGLGTFAPDNTPDEVKAAVKVAVKTGYRHIDCAAAYSNEKAVGQAIKELIEEGVVKRQDLFVVSKLWNTWHRPDVVQPTLKKTLDDLGLEYLDLYLIHWPTAFKEGEELFPVDENGKIIASDVDYVDTWKAMENCHDKGLTRHIGLSNFNSKQIERLAKEARVQPAVLQVEVNCHFSNGKLHEFCKTKNIQLTGYGPNGTPNWSKTEVKLLDEPVIKEIATAHKKTPAQVAIRFVIQRGIASIPKSVTPSRIEENFQVFDFELSEAEMIKLSALDKNYRVYDIAQDHKDYPFNEEF